MPKTISKRVVLTVLPLWCGAALAVFAVGTAVEDSSAATPSPTPATITEEACKKHESAIRKSYEKVIKESETDAGTISHITDEVSRFYTEKSQPEGSKVPNYDALVAALDKRKTVMDDSRDKAREAVSNLSCEDDPGKALAQVRVHVDSTIKALKDYRGAARNLTVTVRTADFYAHRPSPTPEPTGKPAGVL